MTNKEVLDRMYAGEIFEDTENCILYKIENDIFFGKEEGFVWKISFISLIDLNNLEPYQPMPTWYWVTYADKIKDNMTASEIDEIVCDAGDFEVLKGSSDIYIIETRTCQALTKLDAIKIFYPEKKGVL